MANIAIETAEAYRVSGLSCLPAAKARKHPAIGSWKTWQKRLPTQIEVKAWFSNPHDAICCIAGSVSGNLECLDFDNKGELFGAWVDKIDTELLASLVIEQSPSGGYHVLYRSEEAVDGNLKLARGIRDGREKTLIETRGEGGLFLCAPSDGYVLQQGELTNLPVLTQETRQTLLDAARSLDELPRADHATDAPSRNPGDPGAPGEPSPRDGWEVSPGDDFNARGDIHQLLADAGWQFCGVKPDGNEQWTRPGKDPRIGISATYKDGCFWVFSSNASPFAPNVKYNPFAVYATLRHNGDFTAAAADLIRQGYGRAKEPTLGVTFSLDTSGAQPQEDEELSVDDLLDGYGELRPWIIDGFLRTGEIMNVIAAPKTGKSWFVLALAIHVATGREWLGHTCTPSKVLIIDNELHKETISHRLKLVMDAMGVERGELRGRLEIISLRGKWTSLEYIGGRMDRFRDKGYKLIVVDAFYRALPKGTVENDNGAITDLYNMLDRFAGGIGCAFALIHHTSKGNQSMKAVTDVGAGAGSQSRAADTHMTLREHRDDGYLVLEAVVRSFQRQQPIVLKKEFPLMTPDYTKDPEDLAGKAEPRMRRTAAENLSEAERIAGLIPELLTPGRPMPKEPLTKAIIRKHLCTRQVARDAVEEALETGIVKYYEPDNKLPSQNRAKFIVLGDSPMAVNEAPDDVEIDL